MRFACKPVRAHVGRDVNSAPRAGQSCRGRRSDRMQGFPVGPLPLHATSPRWPSNLTRAKSHPSRLGNVGLASDDNSSDLESECRHGAPTFRDLKQQWYGVVATLHAESRAQTPSQVSHSVVSQGASSVLSHAVDVHVASDNEDASLETSSPPPSLPAAPPNASASHLSMGTGPAAGSWRLRHSCDEDVRGRTTCSIPNGTPALERGFSTHSRRAHAVQSRSVRSELTSSVLPCTQAAALDRATSSGDWAGLTDLQHDAALASALAPERELSPRRKDFWAAIDDLAEQQLAHISLAEAPAPALSHSCRRGTAPTVPVLPQVSRDSLMRGVAASEDLEPSCPAPRRFTSSASMHAINDTCQSAHAAPLLARRSAAVAPHRPTGARGAATAMFGLEAPSLSSQWKGSFGSDMCLSEEDQESFDGSGVHSGMCDAFSYDLDLRVARSRQTYEFALSKREEYRSLTVAEMSVWEALPMLDEVPRLSTDARAVPVTDASYMCASLCVEAFPDQPYMPLVGLLHDLGRILSHPSIAKEPSWCVASETYPLGCAFSKHISAFSYLTSSSDRRRAAYQSDVGVYKPHCGWDNVNFTWTGAEYLVHVLRRSGVKLPKEAFFILRYQNFVAGMAGDYTALASDSDLHMLPLAIEFSRVRDRARAGRGEASGAPCRGHIDDICRKAMSRYFSCDVLRW